MQQHLGVFIVLSALVISFIVLFLSKMLPKETKQDIGEDKEPEISQLNTLYDDDILSVRKVERSQEQSEQPELEVQSLEQSSSERAVYVFHIMAKTGQVFKGYELLQALLSQGLRFGEMSIFHRHQQTNGKGPVLFSLTSAVEPGTFDIHNMGSCVCPGLTVFMTSSGSSNLDIDRFNLMVKTAQNIARELGGVCQDKHRVQVTEQLIEQYHRQIYGSALSEGLVKTGEA